MQGVTARRWLAARHLWRPDLQLPPSVRWLQAEGPPSVGGLLAAFAPPRQLEPSGVQLVTIDVDGRPAPDIDGPDGLAMRSIGAMRGAVCVLGRAAAALESSAADLERGGLPTWEARRLASVILGQVLHLADGALPATREGIPRPALAGSSPLSDRIGPDRAESPIFAVDGENPTR